MEKKNKHFSERARIDYQLVVEARSGNQRAFEVLLQRYKDSIFYMMQNMLNNKTDAEDLTFEAFAKAFNSLDQYSEKYSFSTWLFSIATNSCIDFLRKRKIDTVSIDLSQEDQEKGDISLKDSTLNPEQKIIKKQTADRMRREVNKLKDKYKQLIVLRYYKEFTYEEISKELEIPIGTVKTQLYRAKEFLLKNIQKKEQKDGMH